MDKMKDLIERLGENLKYLNPDMDYPYEGWAIAIVEPERFPNLKERRLHLDRLITKIENTWYRVKDDVIRKGVDPSDKKEFCSSLNKVETTLHYFYSESERLTLESLR